MCKISKRSTNPSGSALTPLGNTENELKWGLKSFQMPPLTFPQGLVVTLMPRIRRIYLKIHDHPFINPSINISVNYLGKEPDYRLGKEPVIKQVSLGSFCWFHLL